MLANTGHCMLVYLRLNSCYCCSTTVNTLWGLICQAMYIKSIYAVILRPAHVVIVSRWVQYSVWYCLKLCCGAWSPTTSWLCSKPQKKKKKNTIVNIVKNTMLLSVIQENCTVDLSFRSSSAVKAPPSGLPQAVNCSTCLILTPMSTQIKGGV